MAKNILLEKARSEKTLYYYLTVLCESVEDLEGSAVMNNGYCIVDPRKLNQMKAMRNRIDTLLHHSPEATI